MLQQRTKTGRGLFFSFLRSVFLIVQSFYPSLFTSFHTLFFYEYSRINF
nr:MAG TPA: hypothetical protein [Caudoviricetes sp.]